MLIHDRLPASVPGKSSRLTVHAIAQQGTGSQHRRNRPAVALFLSKPHSHQACPAGFTMIPIDPTAIPALPAAAVTASVFAAAILRGLTGFGFAIAAVPLLSLFLSPVVVVPLVICLQLFGNLFEIRTSLRACHWPSLVALTAGALIGAPAGLLALSVMAPDAARLLIAAATLVAVLLLTKGFTFARPPGMRLTVPVGIVAGAFNGLAAMPGPPVIAYYLSLPVSRTVMRASLNVFFLANASIAVVSALSLKLIDWNIAGYTLLALPLMFAGQQLGLRFFHLGSDRTHRLIAIACLSAIAIGAAIRGLSGMLAN
ncbi:MAG: sulfite exporter TauE/SafE family protein [Pseudorhodoplanes sp.]|nr:MAG: sulfite exporter TauE/SafE family protein [Pseudorhodoplanes sp.]